MRVTRKTAIENGWTWEIPLWSSIGAGYVYSDRFITEANALLEFQQQLTKQGYKDVEKLDYHSISMRIGRHEKAWVKNVCSIGLSFGFIRFFFIFDLFFINHLFCQSNHSLYI